MKFLSFIVTENGNDHKTIFEYVKKLDLTGKVCYTYEKIAIVKGTSCLQRALVPFCFFIITTAYNNFKKEKVRWKFNSKN